MFKHETQIPKISIITICYNEKQIERTCKSIVNQTFQDFEWIVVDGGSTDDTLKILDKYKDRIDILISEKDNGRYNAMNKGIKLAKGEWLNFMNGGDCFYSDDVLEKIFKDKDYNSDVLYGNLIINGKKYRIRKYPKKITFNFFYKGCLPHQSSFIKRELFDKYGMYNEQYIIVSDYEKWLDFYKNNCKFEYINKHVAIFDGFGLSSTNINLSKKERKEVLDNFSINRDGIYNKRFDIEMALLYRKWYQVILSLLNTNRHKIFTLLGIKLGTKNEKSINNNTSI